MKKINTRIIAWIIIALMFVTFIPTVITRVTNEQNNKRVTVSLFYNDLRNKVSEEKLSEMLAKYKAAGINTVTVMEDDVNGMVSRGDVINLKYHDFRHKYDAESVAMANFIGENYPQISYDTYLFILKEERVIKQFDENIPKRYSKYDYVRIGDFEGLVIYAFLNGRDDMQDITVGYNEEDIERLYKMGYDIALSCIPTNYSNLAYLEDLDRLVKKYDVEFLNIKSREKNYDDRRVIRKNYHGIADVINKNNMTLVVTEDSSQLANQKAFGYSEICRLVINNSGTKKIIRSYETYDDNHADSSFYKYRVQQCFNSIVDRNIRFITVTQIAPQAITFNDGAEYSLRAAKTLMKDIEQLGYKVNEGHVPFDYKVPSWLNAGCAAVLIVMFGYLSLCMLFDTEFKKLFLILIIVSAAIFGLTFLVPMGYLGLYATIYCVAAACFAITVMLVYVKKYIRKMNTILGIITTALMLVSLLCIGMLGMTTLLSGVDFYINNWIFRGIKLTLIAPIGYGIIAYYFIFIFNKDKNPLKEIDVEKTLDAEIRVYWLVILAFLGVIGLAMFLVVRYYLMRSGNVDSISNLETAMRNAITAMFPARPRTKEFILGYPCLALFVYYVRHYPKAKIIQWGFAAGTSILAASVTNTFSHVFADASVMYMRVVNGMIIGAVFMAFAYVINLTIIRILTILNARYKITEKIMSIEYLKKFKIFNKAENE